MATIEELEAAVRDAADVGQRVAALDALSTELARTGHGGRALELARQAHELARASGNPQLDARARHAIARGHFYLAEFMPALELLLAAAAQYQEVGDLAGAATAYAGVGLCQHRLGAHEDAITSLLRALQMAREHRLVTLEINVNNSLGPAMLAADRIDEAQAHLDAGIALAQAEGNLNLLTKLLHNRALIERRRGELHLERGDAVAASAAWEGALAQVMQALQLSRQLDNVHDQAHSLGQSGTMLRLLGRFGEADRALAETLALTRTFDGAHIHAEALMEIGLLREAEGRLDEARDCLNDAIERARAMAARPMLAESSVALSRVLEALGDPVGALAMHRQFHAVREAELAAWRKQAAAAAGLWLEFQDAARRAAWYRERAESLEAARDVLARQAREADEASQQDPLTSLLNRRGFAQRSQALIQACRERRRPLTLALVDIDHFKRINDDHSHAVGDEVLRRVAQTIRAHCRHDDLPVRWGGDEFLLLLADADLRSGRRVLERMQLAQRAAGWGQLAAGLVVTLSIGMSAVGPAGAIEGAIAAADRSLYEAKRSGRDRIAP